VNARFLVFLRVFNKNFEMKEEYFCKYDKSYVTCFYETGDEHRDLLQRENLLPSEEFSVSNKNVYTLKVLILCRLS